MFKRTLTLAVSVMFLAGCQSPWLKTPVADRKSEQPAVTVINKVDKTQPQSFKNLAELRAFLASNSNQVVNMSARESGIGGGAMMKTLAAPVADSSGLTGSGNPSYSKTNNQVEGVDEADIVKTDGEYIYYGHNQGVEVVKSFPANEAQVLSKIKINGSVDGIMLYGKKLVVYGSDYNWQPPVDATATTAEKSASDSISSVSSSGSEPSTAISAPARTMGKIASMPFFGGGSNYSYLNVYDVADPRNVKLLADLRLEGGIFGARLIDKYLYVITDKYDYEIGDADPMPKLYLANKVIVGSFPPVHYFPIPYNSYTFTAINALDLSSENYEPKREIYLLDGQKTMYVSEKNIYFGLTKYLNEQDLLIDKTRAVVQPRLSSSDQALIQRIDSLPDEILAKYERQNKINNILMRFGASLSVQEQKIVEEQVREGILRDHPKLADELITTEFHRVSLNGLDIKHEAQGQVPGQLLNQFSLDELQGNLRVAVTRPQSWSQILSEEQKKSSNNLYVLDSNLKAIGTLEGLAPGEQIYAARFMGEKAYLVTFVQTDPLFVIGLSDPTAPKLLGELKIPGFSNYLHAFDENTLIGIGKDTETSQWGGQTTTNLKIALFDVTNPGSPKELSTLKLGSRGSDSSALYDHLAFMFDKSKNILALPVTLYRQSFEQFGYGKMDFNGSLILDLSNKKITEKGRVTHATEMASGSFDYLKAVRRNLIIENNLYTISDGELRINAISDLANVKSINFN